MNNRQFYNLKFLIDGIEECNVYTPAELYAIAESLLKLANKGYLDHTHCHAINQAFVWGDTDDGRVFWQVVHFKTHEQWKKLGIKEKYNPNWVYDPKEELGQIMMEDLGQLTMEDLDGVAAFDKNFEDDMVIGMELI